MAVETPIILILPYDPDLDCPFDDCVSIFVWAEKTIYKLINPKAYDEFKLGQIHTPNRIIRNIKITDDRIIYENYERSWTRPFNNLKSLLQFIVDATDGKGGGFYPDKGNDNFWRLEW